jgi:predicted RNA-binding protein
MGQKEPAGGKRGDEVCESNVFLRDEEGDHLVMEDAVTVENIDGRVRVTDILGEQKEFKGALEEITFLEHRIVIRS